MNGQSLFTAGRRHRRRVSTGLSTSLALLALALSAAPAAAQGALYNEGRRWVGVDSGCSAPAPWHARPLFTTPGLSPSLANMCVYSWGSPAAPMSGPPKQVDIQKLFKACYLSGTCQTSQLTEDVAVVFPQQATPDTLTEHLRTSLAAHVGDASLLPAMPESPAVRVVVLDTTPDAPAGMIAPGENRHGDTLAHLVEEIVCHDGSCAAEVSTVLALPWIESGVQGPNGGHFGTLTDLASAIERAVATWQSGLVGAPATTPEHLILNLSVGWEDAAWIADCSTGNPAMMGPPARAVIGMLQYAASQGALIVAAAGNDSAGPSPSTGLLCPGRYQAVPQEGVPLQSLAVAVSGVDYRDKPIEVTRPSGTTGITALAFGGVAWDQAGPVPPVITGTSVSTAVVSAIGALVWAHDPSLSRAEVVTAIHAGGVDAGSAEHCPLSNGGPCASRRASVCGALQSAGANVICTNPGPREGGSPALDGGALESVHEEQRGDLPLSPVEVDSVALARDQATTAQMDPWTFPQPISPTCLPCLVLLEPGAPESNPPLFLATLGQLLTSATLVVQTARGEQSLPLGRLEVNTSYAFSLLGVTGPVQSAYITGFDRGSYSVTDQVFVQP